MELPQEVEAFYVIPAIRRELARRLVATGMPQRAAAERLGVTPAAVSQYLANKRGTVHGYAPRVVAALDDAAARIAATTDPKVTRAAIDRLCTVMRDEKVICDLHRKHADVPGGCATCFEKA
jgi:hypothetical protein